MKRIPLVALLAVACATAPLEEPKGQVTTQAHPEFAKWRPVAIAVLPVEAPAHQLRREVRDEVYEGLFHRRYSPFKLEVVDKHIGPEGDFEADDLAWDATLAVHITEWRPVRGTDKFAVTATATMTHKNGEVLWECQVDQKPFVVDRGDYSEAAKGLAVLLTSKSCLPDRPPLPAQ